jgi:hypothetical protein
MVELLIAGVSLAAGWGISHYYYARAAKETVTEAAQLRRLVNTLARALQESGHIDANFDANGNLTGVRFYRSLTGNQIAPSGAQTTKPIHGPGHDAAEDQPNP